MSALKQPRTTPAVVMSAPIYPIEAVDTMTDLERLTAAFEAMNPWARELLRDLAEGYAVDFPVPKSAPPLGVDTVKRHEVTHERT